MVDRSGRAACEAAAVGSASLPQFQAPPGGLRLRGTIHLGLYFRSDIPTDFPVIRILPQLKRFFNVPISIM
jgi:hypothetical protein